MLDGPKHVRILPVQKRIHHPMNNTHNSHIMNRYNSDINNHITNYTCDVHHECGILLLALHIRTS